MDKKAALQDVYDSAFNDELEKSAVSRSLLRRATLKRVKDTVVGGVKKAFRPAAKANYAAKRTAITKATEQIGTKHGGGFFGRKQIIDRGSARQFIGDIQSKFPNVAGKSKRVALPRTSSGTMRGRAAISNAASPAGQMRTALADI